MKTIGLIGGMSWESTHEYYKYINEEVKRIKGGLTSAEILLYSYDFSEVEKLQHSERWDLLTDNMVDKALKLKKAGAQMIAICTNTIHLMAPDIEKQIDTPLVHIADATASEIKARGFSKVALLGTEFTMTKDFYKGRIKENFGIGVIVPEVEDQKIIHNIIYD